MFLAVMLLTLAHFSRSHAFDFKDLIESSLNPNSQFQTISTEHFFIHYTDDLSNFAEDVAMQAESILGKIAPEFGYLPEFKTHIVIAENLDRTNAFTTGYPHNQIFFNPVPPLLSQDIDPFGNYIQYILTHELSHILQLNSINGLSKYLSYIAGSWLKPNNHTPLWLKEGIAVSLESKYAIDSGRLNGDFYHMVLRSALQDKSLKNLITNTESITNLYLAIWPWSIRPYLLGALMVNHIEQTEGNAVQKLTRHNSYLFHSFLGDFLGSTEFKSIDDLSNSTYENVYKKIQIDLKKIKAQSITNVQKIFEPGYFVRGPYVAPNGKWLVASIENPFEDNNISFIEIHENIKSEKTPLITRFNGYQTEISKSGRFIVFDDFRRINHYAIFSEIFIYDLKLNKVISNSSGLRARDATISPNGKEIAYVYTEGGNNHIGLSDTKFKTRKTLWKNKHFRRISSLRFFPDGKRLVFSLHKTHGNVEQICILNINQSVQCMDSVGKNDQTPFVSSDGSTVYFSSNRNRVFNLYALNLKTLQVYQITNLTGGGFFPSEDSVNQKIYFSHYDSNGFSIARIPIQRQQWTKVSKIHFKTLEPVSSNTKEENNTLGSSKTPSLDKNSSSLNKTRFKSSNYQAFNYLLPQYLSPQIFFSSQTYQLGLKLGAVDPLYFYRYEINFGYDFATKDYIGGGKTYFGQMKYPITMEANKVSLPVYSSLQIYKEINYKALMNIFLEKRSQVWSLKLGVEGKSFGNDSLSYNHLGPHLELQRDTTLKENGETFTKRGALFKETTSYLIPISSYLESIGINQGSLDLYYPSFLSKQHGVQLRVSYGLLFSPQDTSYTMPLGGSDAILLTDLNASQLNGYPPGYFSSDLHVLGTVKYFTPIYKPNSHLVNHQVFLQQIDLAFLTEYGLVSEISTPQSVSTLGVELISTGVTESYNDTTLSLGLYWGWLNQSWNPRWIFSLNL